MLDDTGQEGDATRLGKEGGGGGGEESWGRRHSGGGREEGEQENEGESLHNMLPLFSDINEYFFVQNMKVCLMSRDVCSC